MLDAYEPEEDVLHALSRKLANVSLGVDDNDDDLDESDLQKAKGDLMSSSDSKCLAGATAIRKHLSHRGDVNEVFKLDILGQLQHLFQRKDLADLQFECAWIVTNLVAGDAEQTQQVMDADLINPLMDCLLSKDGSNRVKLQVSWALANIASDMTDFRENLVSQGVLLALNQLLEDTRDMDDMFDDSSMTSKDMHSDIKALVWIISIMCLGGFKTAEHWSSYLPVFRSLANCLEYRDTEILINACWGISRILSNMHSVKPFYAGLRPNQGFCSRLIELLHEVRIKVLAPVLRTIASLTSWPNPYVKALLDAGLLDHIQRLMAPSTPVHIRRDAFLIVSNLAGGTEDEAQFVQRNSTVMGRVMECITIPGRQYNESVGWFRPETDTGGDWKLTTEALWTLCNLTCQGNDESMCNLLVTYKRIPTLLARFLLYTKIPLTPCLKAVDTIINIMGRAVLMEDETGGQLKNPYIRVFLNEVMVQVLAYMRKRHPVAEILERTDYLSQILQDCAAKANRPSCQRRLKIKTTSAHARHIVHDSADGDVRLIEQALGKLIL